MMEKRWRVWWMSALQFAGAAMVLWTSVPALAQVEVQGQVVDIDGGTVAGAEVDLHLLNSNGQVDYASSVTVVTDAGGSFQANVPAGTYVPVVTLGAESTLIVFRVVPLTLDLSESATPRLAVQTTTGLHVAGTLLDEDGVPVAGARVSGGRYTRLTDAQGRFVVAASTAPSTLRFMCGSSVSACQHFSGAGRADTVEFPVQSAGTEYVWPRLRQVAGTVTGPTGTAAPDVRVALSYQGGDGAGVTWSGTTFATTDAQGTYSTTLGAGSVSAVLTPPETATLVPTVDTKTLPDVTPFPALDFQMGAAVPYAGTLVDSAGRPIAGAAVTVLAAPDGSPMIDEGTTAEDGTFSVYAGTGAMNVNVLCDPPSCVHFGENDFSLRMPELPADRGPIADAEIVWPVVDVDMLLLDSDGRPVSGARLSGETGSHDWFSAADGRFRMRVPQGAYRWQVSPPRGSGLLPIYAFEQPAKDLPASFELQFELEEKHGENASTDTEGDGATPGPSHQNVVMN